MAGNTGSITLTASLDDKLSAGLKSLQNEVNLLADAIKAQKLATDAANQAIQAYQKATDTAKTAAEQEKTALLAKIAALRGNTAEAQLHTQALLDQQKATLAAATGDEKLAEEVINLREEFKRLQEEEKRQNTALEEQAETTRKGQAALSQLATTVGVALTAMGAAAIGAFSISVKAAADFDEAMANVSTLVDTGVVSMADLRKEVLRLPPELGNATDMANGLYKAISAGVTDPQEALGFIAQAAKFARANLADMGSSVDFLTTILNAYKLKTQDVTHVTDVFTRAIILGKTTGQELSQSIGMVIPVAALLKVPLEELAAALVTMTLQGIQTDHAVISLNQVLTTFLNPTSQAKDLARELGVELSASAIKTHGLREAISTLADRIAKMNDGPLKDEAISIFFGNVRALRGVLALTGEQAETFDKTLRDLQNSSGATAIAFDKQAGATNNLFRTFLNNLSRLAIEIGGTFLPAINSIITQLSDVVTWFRAMDTSTQTVITVVGLAGGVLFTFAGLFLLLLPRIISTVTAVGDLVAWLGSYQTATAAATAATGGLTTATEAATTVFLANPITAIAALLLMLEVNFNLVSGAAFYLVEGAKAAWGALAGLGEQVSKHIDNTSVLGTAWGAITSTLNQWRASVANTTTGLGEFTTAQNQGISVAELRRQKDVEQKDAIDKLQAALSQMNSLQRDNILTQTDATASTQGLTDAQRQAQAAIESEIRSMATKIEKLQFSKGAQDDMTLSALTAKLGSEDLAQKYLDEKQTLETLEAGIKSAKAAEEERNRVKKQQADAQREARDTLEQERLEMDLSTAALQGDKTAIDDAKAALNEHNITRLAAKLGSEDLARAIIEEKNQHKALETQVKATSDAEKLLDEIKRNQPDVHKSANDKIYDDFLNFANSTKAIEQSLGDQHASVLALKLANEENFNQQLLASKNDFALQVAGIVQSAADQELAIDQARVDAIITNNAATLEERVKLLQDYVQHVSDSKTTLLAFEKEIHDNTIDLSKDQWDKKTNDVNRWYNDEVAAIERAVRQNKLTRDEADSLEVDATNAKFSKIRQIEADYDKDHRTVLDSLLAAWEDFSNETVKKSEAAYNAFKNILTAAGTFFKEAFVAVITLDFGRLADAFRDFAESIFKAFSDLIARIIAEWAIANLGIKTAILAILEWIKEIFTQTSDEIGKTVPTFTSAIIDGMLPAIGELALAWAGFNAEIMQTNDLLGSMNAGGGGGGMGGVIQNIAGLVSGVSNLGGGLGNLGGGLGNISGILQRIPWASLARLGAFAVPLAGAGIGFVGGSLLGKLFGLGPQGQNILGGAGGGGIGVGLGAAALGLGPLGVGIAAILGAFGGGFLGSLFGGKKRPPRRGFVLGTQFQGLIPGEDDEFHVGKIDVFVKAIKRLSASTVEQIAASLEQSLRIMTTLWGGTFNKFPKDIRHGLIPLIMQANKKIREVYEEITLITRKSLDPAIEDLLRNAPGTVTQQYRKALKLGIHQWLQQLLDINPSGLFQRPFPIAKFPQIAFYNTIADTIDAFIKRFSEVEPEKQKRFIISANDILTTFETFVKAGDLFNEQDITNLFTAFQEVVGNASNLPIKQAEGALNEFNQLLESAVKFQQTQRAIIDTAPLSEFGSKLKDLKEKFAASEQAASDLNLTLDLLHEAEGIQLRDLIGIKDLEGELANATTPALGLAIQKIEQWWADMAERATAISEGIKAGTLTPEDAQRFLAAVEGLQKVKLGNLTDEFLRPLEEQLATLEDKALPAYRDFFTNLNSQLGELLGKPVDFMAQFEVDLKAIDKAAIDDALDVANRAIKDVTDWLDTLGDFASIADTAAKRVLDFQLSTIKGIQDRISELTGVTVTNAATAVDAIRSLLEAARNAPLEERADLLGKIEESLRLAESLSEAERNAQKDNIEKLAEDQRNAISADAENRDALLKTIADQEAASLKALDDTGQQDTERLIAVWGDLQKIAQAAEEEARKVAIDKLEEVRAAVEAQQTALEARIIEARDAIDKERQEVAAAIAALEANLITALHDIQDDFANVLRVPPPPFNAVVDNFNATVSAQHGINYIPRDDFLVRAHKGEAVITAQGNEALAQMARGGLRYVPLESARNEGRGGPETATGMGNGDVLADKVARAVAHAMEEKAVNVTVQIEPAPVILDGRQVSEVTLQVIKQQGEAGRKLIPSTAVYMRK